ncbi:RNA polymerase sigma factor [soil metagenome]
MTSQQDLSNFLESIERRAFKQAVYAVRDDDAACDIVQEAMLKLATRYADKPPAEWPLLFARILQNAVHDHFRRAKVRAKFSISFSSLFGGADDEDDTELLEALAGPSEDVSTHSAEDVADGREVLAIIESAIADLPARQREAFVLRYWEEFDVSETARVMGCSEGSVKTHCSRACHALARVLTARGLSLASLPVSLPVPSDE